MMMESDPPLEPDWQPDLNNPRNCPNCFSFGSMFQWYAEIHYETFITWGWECEHCGYEHKGDDDE